VETNTKSTTDLLQTGREHLQKKEYARAIADLKAFCQLPNLDYEKYKKGQISLFRAYCSDRKWEKA
jgi:outer membrane protein assembly factor BamD (BamD/ComL family)